MSKELVYFYFFFKQGTQVRSLRNGTAATACETFFHPSGYFRPILGRLHRFYDLQEKNNTMKYHKVPKTTPA